MKNLLMIAFACAGLMGLADVQINNLNVRQRYPWNGKVDITFDVVAAEGDSGLLNVRAVDASKGINITLRTVTLDGQNCQPAYGNRGKFPLSTLNGTHTIVWDSTADYQTNRPEHLTYEVSIERPQQLPDNEKGIPIGILGEVATVDLTTGEVKFYSCIDTGTLNSETYKTTKMAFVKVPAGGYLVGRTTTAKTPITFTQAYWIGLHEVTRQQYVNVVGSDPSDTAKSEGMFAPVQKLTWNTIMSPTGFIAKVNAKITASSAQLRLPTEAQWEVASRAGTTTTWFFGATGSALGEYAVCNSNSEGKSRTAGTKKPNPWGIYDMYGNVWEFCNDVNSTTYPSESIDPTGAPSSTQFDRRVERGGGYNRDSDKCNSTISSSDPQNSGSYDTIGFRAALIVPGSL